MINQGLMKLWLSPPLALKWFHREHGRRSRLHYQTTWQEGKGWHRCGKTWQLLLPAGDARKPRNPGRCQERGCAASVWPEQETGLIAELKITESLPVHPSLSTGRLNKCGHTGLWVKWKDVKCPGLQVWGGFAPLKSIRLFSTSSLVSLVWDHHRRSIFSFGQVHIDHIQKWVLSYRMDIEHLSMASCRSWRDHTQFWKKIKPSD